MARIYSNENFPLPVVLELRRLGHDVLTTHDAGKSGKSVPDEEVLNFARQEGRAVLTLNRKHFIRLHQQGTNHAGIIVCTLDLDFTGQARRIHDALIAAPELPGQLLRVNRPPA
jgi:predicted nuclease of predicted toxin-antitoxin system